MGGSCPAHGDKIYWMENTSSDLSNNVRARNVCSVQLDVTNVTLRPRPAFFYLFFLLPRYRFTFFFPFFYYKTDGVQIKEQESICAGPSNSPVLTSSSSCEAVMASLW